MVNTTLIKDSDIQLVVIPKEVWSNITSGMEELKNLLNKKLEDEQGNEWLTSAQARKMLNICSKTWQTYRDKKVIPFYQYGKKIQVKRTDIEAFKNTHCISAEK